MISDNDLDACFSTGDFAQAVTFGGTLEVNAIFNDGTDASSFYGVEIESTNPSLICKTADVSTVKPNHSVVVDGRTFKVEKISKAAAGMTTIYLKS